MKNRLIVATATFASLVALQPYRPFVVSGTSMSPTFASGQLLLANARPHDLSRGDVVVFRHEGETMVKRVAYLEGDSIERFWFAGEWKTPETGKAVRSLRRQGAPRQTWSVPPGSVYVLADNPWGSIDSRDLGPIPFKEILAVVPNVDQSAEWAFAGARRGSALVAQL